MESNTLMTMDEAKMLLRVEMARFPQDLTVDEKKLLAQVAITYGFDPLMGEVTIYEGRPFVSIDGRYRKAQESGRLDGVETRPATKQERADWQIPDEDWFFRSEVYVKDASHSFIAWGRVRVSETKPGSRRQGDATSTYKPIQNNPQRMAEKRAEAQALRKAFHIPLPSFEDIGSPDYDVDSTAVRVDIKTGELTEGKPKPEKKTNGKVGSGKTEQPDTRGEFEKEVRDIIEEAIKAAEPQSPPERTTSKSSPVVEESSPIDLVWLKESLERLSWADVGGYLRRTYKVSGQKVSDMVKALSPEQAQEFMKEVQTRLEML